MGGYGNLPDTIGKLKRAAIDAYMVADYASWAGQMWTIEAGKYTMGSTEVTRPDANGQGGGDWSGDWDWFIGGQKDEEFIGKFDEIRGRIDDALDHWTANLPVVTDIGKRVSSARTAMMKMGISPSAEGGVTNSSGPIGGYLNLVNAGLDDMSGATIEAFKGGFLGQLTRVIANQYAMTIPIGGMLEAEENIWREARQDVANTAQLALDSMNAVIAGSGPNWDLTLKVVGLAVQGAGIFATGGVKAATDVASLGVTLLSSVPDDPKASAKQAAGGTCFAVLDALDATMKQINTSITAQETALDGNLSDNLGNMEAQQTNYDIPSAEADLGVEDAQDPGVDITLIQPAIVAGIVDQHLPDVAKELEAAGTALWECYSSTELGRPPGIGLAHGPSYFAIMYKLYKCIADLAWEVRSGAKSLDLAIEDLQNADGASQAALDDHREKVGEGSGWDPFPT